jgi:chorismate-pyruvate lyase
VATPSGLAMALARTTGTVTAFLEQLVGEPIDARERRHEMTHSGTTDSLGVGPGRQLLKRTVVLRGRRSANAYLYAESLLVPGRLPAAFFRRLESSVDPIGRILTEEGIAFTRVPLPDPDRRLVSLYGDTAPALVGCPLARAYRVDVSGIPVMVITEWFLSTLQSFEGERHQDVDKPQTVTRSLWKAR